MVIKAGETSVSRNYRNPAFPSVRWLMNTHMQLPSSVYLPTSGGGRKEQRVEFIGLPNQCFYCKQIGHFEQDCARRKTNLNVGKRDNQQLATNDRNFGLNGLEIVNRNVGENGVVNRSEGEWHDAGKRKVIREENLSICNGNLVIHNRFNALQEDEGMMEHSLEITKGAPKDDSKLSHGMQGPSNNNLVCLGMMEFPTISINRKLVDETNRENRKLEKCPFLASSSSFQPPKFQAPKASVFINNTKATKRPKKRSLKSRGKKQGLNPTFGQMTILNYKISEISITKNVNIQQYGKMFFPYAFTKHFQIKEAHESSPIRVHVLCKTTMEKGIEMYRGGFSFMLCIPPTCDWGLVDVDEMLKGQVLEFAQCLRNETLINAITTEWRRMNVRCRMDLDKEGIRHMVVSCHV